MKNLSLACFFFFISCVTADPYHREPDSHWLTLNWPQGQPFLIPGTALHEPIFIHGFQMVAKKPNNPHGDEDLKSSFLSGKKIYHLYCSNCHGESGKGNGPLANKLPVKPANLFEKSKTISWEDFFLKVSNGGDAMPAWKHLLNEKEISHLSVYVKSLDLKP